MTKSRGIRQRHAWSEGDLAVLRARYPNERASVLAADLGRPIYAIYSKAYSLGLAKSAEFYASAQSGRTDGQRGVATRFQARHATWNKAAKGLVLGGEATQFQPGNRPHTWRPIGSERLCDGYRQRKVTDTGCTTRDWVGIHILLWTEHHGPVPPGHVVAFKDRDRTHIDIDNLELVPRVELMRRNSLHNLPPELVEVIRLSGSLSRQINKRSKQ